MISSKESLVNTMNKSMLSNQFIKDNYNYSIAAIVVTYNRKDLLEKNLRSCLNQDMPFTKIFVIDNGSTDSTKEMVLDLFGEHLKNGQIEYFNAGKNLGGAGGFKIGLQYASSNGSFDFFYLMDDDGRPSNSSTLSTLIKYTAPEFYNNKLIFSNSLVMVDERHLSFRLFNEDMSLISDIHEMNKAIYFNTANPFNGTLVSRYLVEKIGYPLQEYFIGGDEVEYQERAKRAGATILTVRDSLYTHPSPYPVGKSDRKSLTVIWKPWKEYYCMRNMCNTIKINNKRYKFKAFIFYIKRKIKIMFHANKCDKKKCLFYIRLGYQHFKKNKFGIYIYPDYSLDESWKE